MLPLCIGIASILLLMLVWAALDDITTDSAKGQFAAEYLFLVICGVWFAAVATWLLVRRRVLAGVISLFAVALAVAAFWSLPHHYAPVSPVNHLGLFSLAWFLGLAVWMVARRVGPVETRNR